MKLRTWLMTTILVVGVVPLQAEDEGDIFGKKAPPGLPKPRLR